MIIVHREAAKKVLFLVTRTLRPYTPLSKNNFFAASQSSVMYSRPIMQNIVFGIDFRKGHIVHIFYSNFEINHIMKIKHVKNV